MLAEIGGAQVAGRFRERTWWLISRCNRGQTESMTFSLGGREVLAVFSYEEEADLFLWSLGTTVGDNWSVRESRCGENGWRTCNEAGSGGRHGGRPVPGGGDPAKLHGRGSRKVWKGRDLCRTPDGKEMRFRPDKDEVR